MINNFFYITVDVFFNAFHIIAILVNCFGWAYQKTLKLNLVFLLLTISSWSILGSFYGIGFCFLTMLHSLSLDYLGSSNIPFSYVDYIILQKLGLSIASNTISLISVLLIFTSLSVSLKKNSLTKDKSLIWFLWISCTNWLIIVNKKGIGFMPDWNNIFISLTLIVSFVLIGKISYQLLRKNF